MRENTERPITVEHGPSRLVRAENLAEHVQMIVNGKWQKGSCPPLWYGKTAERAAMALKARL